MAKRGVSLNPGYISGSHWANCDFCDHQFRAEDLQETWDHFWVCDEDYEKRHEQDFLRVRPEVITVQDPIRPSNTDNVIDSAQTIGGTTTTAATWANVQAVTGSAEVGLAIAGKNDIPTATHGLTDGLVDLPTSSL